MGTVVHATDAITDFSIAAAIFCVDCRFTGNQEHFAALREHLNLEKIYEHRIAGPDLRLSEKHERCFETALFQVGEVSELTGTKLCLVGGHGNCARHAVTDEEHRKDTLTAAENVAASLADDWVVLPLFFPLVGKGASGEDQWGIEILKK